MVAICESKEGWEGEVPSEPLASARQRFSRGLRDCDTAHMRLMPCGYGVAFDDPGSGVANDDPGGSVGNHRRFVVQPPIDVAFQFFNPAPQFHAVGFGHVTLDQIPQKACGTNVL